MKAMKNKRLAMCVAGAVSLVCITLLLNQYHEQRSINNAKSVVINLYTMNEGLDRINSIDNVRKLCTPEVANQLIEDYDDKLLYKYLEQSGSDASVRIKYATESYVVYSIVSDNINEDRKFIFIYQADWKGKICAVEEAELNDFVTDDI